MEASKKPFITMHDEIRFYFMDRLFRMLQKINKWNVDVFHDVVKKMTNCQRKGVITKFHAKIHHLRRNLNLKKDGKTKVGSRCQPLDKRMPHGTKKRF